MIVLHAAPPHLDESAGRKGAEQEKRSPYLFACNE